MGVWPLASRNQFGAASAVFAYRRKNDGSPVLGTPHRSWLERVDEIFHSKMARVLVVGGGRGSGCVCACCCCCCCC